MATVELVEQALAREDPAAARAALIELLEAREGDAVAAVSLRVLARGPFAPDAMAKAVERLVALVRAQEGQILALRAMIETRI